MASLTRAGHTVSTAATSGPQTAGALARQSIASGADLIVTCGGDGTINEVAEGMIGEKVPLAVLPGGTANVLANELGLGATVERAAERLSELQARRISAGRIRSGDAPERYFVMMAGVGLDAHLVYRVTAGLKDRWGKAAYWICGFGELVRDLEEFDVEIDGRVRRASFALVSKVKNYGGDLNIARSVSLVDDTFEVVLFEGVRSRRYLKYLAGVMTNQLRGMSGVTVLRTSRVRFSGSPGKRVYMQVDGEYAGHLPGEVEIVPDALTLLME